MSATVRDAVPAARAATGAAVPACRNCGAPAEGAYCPRCGQETTTVLPSARQFLRDAAGRYVAFDGRTWRTLAALLFRPGFLTREYFAGRRRRYIRPARLFLVLSLAMFLVIRVSVGVVDVRGAAMAIDDEAQQEPRPETGPSAPSATPARGAATTGAGTSREPGDVVALPGITVRIGETGVVDVEGDGPVGHALKQRMERFNALPAQERVEQVVLGTLRYGPYAMFVLLPAFAFLLLVVYAGSHRRHPRRPRRYAEHLVFAAHNHAFFFLVVALAVALPWTPVKGALLLWTLVYGLGSAKVVYGGGLTGLLARAALLAVAYGALFVAVTVGLLVAAVVLR